jgi:RHS repeat-associated protein
VTLDPITVPASRLSRLLRRRWHTVRSGVVVVAGVALLSPMIAKPAAAAASTPAVSYTYDASGRLASVTTAAGTATYHYDAEGNLLSISSPVAAPRRGAARSRNAAPALASAQPPVVTPGTTITITGRGFSTAADKDLVHVGALFARVTKASATRLEVTAPPGTGGVVRVTTPGGTARGPQVKVSEPAARTAPRQGRDLHPLRAPAGVTALSGLVENNRGVPLAGISISVLSLRGTPEARTATGADGQFLLTHLSAGRHQLVISGNGAGRQPQYGIYAEPVELPSGRTTVLPWVTYLTPLDLAHAVTLTSPTAHAVTLTTPKIPGLKVEIPQGTVIRDRNGHVVTKVSITPLTVGRTPYPLAPGMQPGFFFTLQPGDATVSGPGLRVIYPNETRQPPGTAIPFLIDTPTWPGMGWWRYGTGHVSPSGKQIIPDPGARWHEISLGGFPLTPPPDNGPPPGDPCNCGDPANTATGLYTYQHTDLTLPDVQSVTLGRTYRQLDDAVRDFGIGMSSSLNLYIAADNSGNFDLYLPDGGKIVYAPVGTTGRYQAVGTPAPFVDSTLTWTGTPDPFGPFTIQLTNGTALSFSDPAYLTQITDRFGNSVTINRNEFTFNGGQIRTITTPDGEWLKFTYGSCVASSPSTTCITQVQDNSGRTLTYSYDPNGRLTTVTDPAGGTTRYSWAACTTTITCTELLSVTDPNGHTIISNAYDPTTGLVTGQTDGNGGTWAYSYSTSQGQIVQANVTDPRGVLHTLSFDASGYLSAETDAAGTSTAATTHLVYNPTTHLLTSQTDPLGHVTSYVYDTRGNLTSLTELSGTAHPSTWTVTYDPAFSRVTSVTDPLGHTTTIAYDDPANTVSVTDALGHVWVITLNNEGQPIQATDPLGNTTYLSYLYGALVAVANPLGEARGGYYDSVGQLLQVTDPAGNTTTYTWTPLHELQTVTDPLGGVTSFGYDPGGRLTSLTDANGHTTTFGYDTMGQLTRQTDPLGASDTYAYDPMGNLTSHIDRKGSKSTYSYDSLGRLITAKYGVSGTTSQSSINYTWDLGSRLTKAVDSAAGTYTFSYDGLNDVLSASSPQGKMSYTYNAAGLRTGMTVPGQAKVIYSYDHDNRLTKITQGTSSVASTYDASSRPASLTLPDGITRKITYDAASEPTAIKFTHGATQVGTLGYTYNADSLVSSVSGSLAAASLPTAVSNASYNADNELTSRNGVSYSYDSDGNLVSGGTNSYTWNARGKLASISGGTTASFTYDPFGRRQSATVNGTATSFLYDGLNVVQELAGTIPTANLLTGGLDQVFQLTTPSGTNSSFLTNTLGSTIALANSAAQVTTSYTYDPSGAVTASGAASPNTFEFAGTQNDGTGLYAMGARSYSPALGRFTSQDPTGFNGGTTNLYGYALDDPVNLKDPLGLACFSKIGAAAGGAAGKQLGQSFAPQTLGVTGAILGGLVGGILGFAAGGPVGAVLGAEEGGELGADLGAALGATPVGNALAQGIGTGVGAALGGYGGGLLGLD